MCAAMSGSNNFVQAVSDFTRGNHGDSLRIEKAGKPGYETPPNALYLVYLGFDADGNLIVRQLLNRQIQGSLTAAEEELLKYAIANQNIESTNFERMAWNFPCYITFVVDKDDWKFYQRTREHHDPLKFLEIKDLESGPSQPYDQNKSFYDGKIITVKRPDGKKRNAVRCVNYLRNENGDLLQPGETRDYCFEIYLEAPFAVPQTPVRHITILIDPDGQNQGPPLPPPLEE
jgi:hypothetical protein